MKDQIVTQALRFNNPNAVNGLENKKRNEALFKDYKAGMEIFDICAKYRITSSRFYVLIKKLKQKEASK